METVKVHKLGKGLLKNFYFKKAYYSLSKTLAHIINDESFLKIMYQIRIGRTLDLKNPKLFTEKIQWLKLYHRDTLLNKLADKYEVRKYVSKKYGSDILIPLVGVYGSFEEINFDNLPEKFILKATHGSGWNLICTDKNGFDLKNAKKNIKLWLKTNYFYPGRNWEYKDIKPRVICEHFLSDKNKTGLDDYKIHCFNGNPLYIQFITGRFKGDTQEVFFNSNWKKQDFVLTFKKYESEVKRPKNFKGMLEIARRLSKDLPYARIDLYNCDGKIYFGEITLHPANGMDNFTPKEYDLIFGNKLDLNKLMGGR